MSSPTVNYLDELKAKLEDVKDGKIELRKTVHVSPISSKVDELIAHLNMVIIEMPVIYKSFISSETIYQNDIELLRGIQKDLAIICKYINSREHTSKVELNKGEFDPKIVNKLDPQLFTKIPKDFTGTSKIQAHCCICAAYSLSALRMMEADGKKYNMNSRLYISRLNKYLLSLGDRITN